MTRAWDRLTLPGKVVFTVVPLLLVLGVGLLVVLAVFGQHILDILVAQIAIVRFVVAATVILLLASPHRPRSS
jgi:hypothetical protein